jgi:hypothetical protein
MRAGIHERLMAARQLVLALGLALLSGCATPYLLDTASELPPSGQGVVFNSFSYQETDDRWLTNWYASTSITLVVRPVGPGPDTKPNRDLSTTARGLVYGGWTEPTLTRRAQGRVTLIAAAQLPPGEYEAEVRDVYLPLSAFTYQTKLWLHPPLRFSVQANQITYPGAHRFTHVAGRNLLGMPVPASVKAELGDELHQDYQALVSTRPHWRTMKVANGLLP